MLFSFMQWNKYFHSNFKAVINRISNFHEIAPKFHIFTKIVIKAYLEIDRPTASTL